MPETQGVGSLENMDQVFEVTPLKKLSRRLKARLDKNGSGPGNMRSGMELRCRTDDVQV